MANVPVTGFSLSDTPELEYVLSDIPFFCIGLTALAVFAFFIVMRRINPSAIYLYTSSLFAFGAAILDLSQILLRGTTNTNQGLGLNTVTGIANTREVGFALAFGFRFLYLWAFVAQRPRYEPRPSSQIDPLFSATHTHSASWERWGVPGFLLKYTLLGAVISMPVLQIIWRIATGNSPVYIAESTIQIAVSILLIAKLLLNLFLSTVAPWWRPFLPYMVPITALMISTGIGTGNVLFFKFSETTLGRFLQAVETYLLLVSMLIFTFYNVPQYVPPAPVTARIRSSFFGGLPPKLEQSPFQVSPPNVETPIANIPVTLTDRRVSRSSPVSRISSWINPRRPQRPTSGEQKLWNTTDAEMGITVEARTPSPEDVEDVLSPRVVKLDVEKARFSLAPAAMGSAEPQPDAAAPLSPTTLEVVSTPSTGTRPFTGVSFSSYYGMATASRLTMPSSAPGDDARATDSPVYGLNGIIVPSAPESPTLARRPSSPTVPPMSFAPPSPLLAPSTTQQDQRTSANSFDELLRQQSELDKSIAALRLFSPNPTASIVSRADTATVDGGRTAAAQTSRSFSVSSDTNRSEFSLSNFPDPPLVDRASVLPDSLIAGGAAAASEAEVAIAVEAPAPVAPAPAPAATTTAQLRGRRQSQVPLSAVSEADGQIEDLPTPAHMRFGSAGTQYDVTSFIGDLMIPGTTPERKMSVPDDIEERPESDSGTDIESPVITTGSTLTLRPLLLSSTAPSITSLPPATASSGVLNSSSTGASSATAKPEYPVLRPLLLGAAPTVPSPLSAGARRTPGPSVFSGPRGRSGSRRGERPVISVPRQQAPPPEEVAEAFEKPRKPPQLRLDS